MASIDPPTQCYSTVKGVDCVGELDNHCCHDGTDDGRMHNVVELNCSECSLNGIIKTCTTFFANFLSFHNFLILVLYSLSCSKCYSSTRDLVSLGWSTHYTTVCWSRPHQIVLVT